MGFNATVPTVSAGAAYPSATYNSFVAGGLNGIQAAWTTWTPVITSGLTVGNGTVTAAYKQIGKDIKARLTLLVGSTSVVGVAIIQFPVPILVAGYPSLGSNVGHGTVLDSSAGSASRQGCGVMVNSTVAGGFGNWFIASNSGQMNATTPFVWATGDLLSVTLLYEAA